MNLENSSFIIQEIKTLISKKLYQSADQLGHFYLSALNNSTNYQSIKQTSKDSYYTTLYEINQLIGDASFEKKEYKRSLGFYQISLQQLKKANDSSSVINAVRPEEIELQYKQALCYYELKDSSLALRQLENISTLVSKPLHVNLLLGEIYTQMNKPSLAIEAYKNALLQSPMAIEIVEKLIDLGIPIGDLFASFEIATKSNKQLINFMNSENQWYLTLIQSIFQRRNYESELSATTIQKISTSFPKNPYLTIQLTLSLIDNYQPDMAMNSYRSFRKLDTTSIYRIDSMGKLLYDNKEEAELCRLTQDLLENSPKRPEGWLLAAYYAALKQDNENVAGFLDKALLLNPRYAEAYLFRGNRLLEKELYDRALASYNLALQIKKSPQALIGIFNCNLGLNKLKDAAMFVRDLITTFPRCPEGLFVMGKMLIKSPQGVTESIKAFSKAIVIQPRFTEAIITMNSHLFSLGRYEEVIQNLKEALNRVSDPQLRILMAKALFETSQYYDALYHLQICLTQHPKEYHLEATKEIEKIEAILGQSNETNKSNEYEDYDEANQEIAVEEDSDDYEVDLEEELESRIQQEISNFIEDAQYDNEDSDHNLSHLNGIRRNMHEDSFHDLSNSDI